MRRVYSLEQSREDKSSLDDDIKEHINCIAIIQYTHNAHMDNAWTLEQVYAVEAQLQYRLHVTYINRVAIQ